MPPSTTNSHGRTTVHTILHPLIIDLGPHLEQEVSLDLSHGVLRVGTVPCLSSAGAYTRALLGVWRFSLGSVQHFEISADVRRAI